MKQDFDNFAEQYRQIHTDNVQSISGADSYYFAEYKVKELLQFETNVQASMLDLGCGDGATEIFLQQYLPKIVVTGIDVSYKSIEVAMDRKLPNASFNIYDGFTIPYANNTFHIVFVAGVLHHVPKSQRQQLVNEIARVLQPGGRLYLFEHNPYNPLTKYLVRTCVFDEGVELLKAKETAGLLQKSGLAILEKRYVIFFPRGRFFRWLHKAESMLAHFPLGGQYYFRAVKK